MLLDSEAKKVMGVFLGQWDDFTILIFFAHSKNQQMVYCISFIVNCVDTLTFFNLLDALRLGLQVFEFENISLQKVFLIAIKKL